MFDVLKKLFFEGRGDGGESAAFSEDDQRVAEAALMFHVIAADGIVTEQEKQSLSQRVSRHFDLSSEETRELIDAARDADSEAVDFYRFTSMLKRELDYEARLDLIANLWEMVYADGVVHELEDNIVWRIAELLDVTARDRMELKRRVREGGDVD